MNDKTTMIDPPSGWKYGFPKKLPKDVEPIDANKWLVENGYPQEEIDKYGDFFFCRYWVIDSEENELKPDPIIERNKKIDHLNIKDMIFEIDLEENKFKKKYFEDKSGYWFERKFKFPVFDKIRCFVEVDNKKLYLEVRHKREDLTKEFTVLNWKECKKILKQYKLI
jgi:hypothetical protein